MDKRCREPTLKNPLPPASDFCRPRGAAVVACLLAAACVSGLSAPEAPGWRILAPLPDPVGYGGMFAGVLDGRLVTGGGSQWDRPIWLKGQRCFSDRVFTLAAPDGKWVEETVRLPARCGYFASGTTADAIYLAGGLDPTGCVRAAWLWRAEHSRLVSHPLPDLPHPLGYACGAVAGGRFWVMGGLRDPNAKEASQEVWSLDVTGAGDGHWRREADLPGPGVFVATAAANGPDLYLFGGMAFDAAGKFAPSPRAYHLNTADRTWRKLPDLPEPRVGSASPAPVLNGRQIFLIGGYGEISPAAQREHPGFPPQTLYFDLQAGTWGRGPVLPVTPVPDRDAPGDPGPAPMIGAPAARWQGYAVVIGGEVRASVRTPAVVAWPMARPLAGTPPASAPASR